MFPIILVVAYLLGSVSFGFIIVKLRKGIDIRTVGSGNIGATNVKRILGWPAAIQTYIFDTAKGILPVWLSMYIFVFPNWQTTLVGVAVILGHLFPVFLGFRGGKGIATFSGILFVLNPLAVLVALPVWRIVLWVTKYSSLSSLAAAFTVPVVAVCEPGAWTSQHLPITLFSIVVLFTALYTHRANIRRLLKGEENKT